ncbi:DUF87 domain-containing protein (plasmid) [Halarchaeum sp. CBA1220]|uniref:helicase HerA domain-containing protein n=1 Tax=Halarchaeum sp. CBA1220 TaxID=1853682 RepID=UPI000F3AA4BA|nr:DUF87 domain-containing protein [Halarchaeum sp. CBA1220]QLC35528.1 DUF87 domain-containing protein [Halarchaeum sp. CBA1220]
MREYQRVTPTSETLDPAGIPRVLESLHKLTPSGSSGIGAKLNPFQSSTPPRFEFLALSEGPNEPVEFYYGADEHLGTVEERLRSIYPETFDVERVDVDVASRLVQPVEYTREEFVEQYTAGNLQYEFGVAERYDLTDVEGDTSDSGTEPGADGGVEIDLAADRIVRVGETAVELAPSSTLPDDEPVSALDKPTVTDGGTILARPTVDAVSPLGVRWCGAATRKADWMTTLTPFTDAESEESLTSVDQPGSTLASLIDHLMEASAPVAFQVVFQRHASWQSDAEVRKEELIDGRDTLSQKIIGGLLDSDIEHEHDERELSDAVAARLDAIDAKNPKRSFTVNVRVIGVPQDDPEVLDSRLDSLAPVFDPLDGPFYDVTAKRLRDDGFREAKKEKNARAALQRLLDREIMTGRGKTRPDLVLSGQELANFVLVPSSEQLSVEGTRGTRAEQQSRNPLPRPHQDLMREFREGMAIGTALDETGEPEDVPTRLPPRLLRTHYGRFGTTGSGKSKALINDMLSLYETTAGPTILIDPKGDGMAENYLRAHAVRFGLDDLEENVIHFPIPEILPGFSFFNIEPALANGQRREDAVQQKADHYEEILKLVMGTERYERATVAPGLIKTLIKALFDDDHGRENGQYRESTDYFAHRQLENALDKLWAVGPPQPDFEAAPQSSDEEVTRSLRRQLQLDQNTFSNVMGGVGNRLSAISDDTHLRRIFNNTEPQFDFRDVLDDDAVVLFDLGDLREDAARVMTGVILTNLADALQETEMDTQTRDEYVVNLLIDEAASVAVSNIMNTLLEQGRSFDLSVGLSMQFPEQMAAEGGRKAYLNVLNNIGSPLVGKINVDRELAQAMAHEDMDTEEFTNRIRALPRGEWIASLPSPTFGETGPYPFSLEPLPIPDGHPESERPLTEREEAQFADALDVVHERTEQTFGVPASVDAPGTETPAELGEILDVADGELDVALAKIVRSVQLRTDVRAENGWVPVETADDELRRLFEDVDATAPSYEELANIRQRSRFLDTTVDMESDNLVIRLTDDGEGIAAPDTGSVRSAGGQKHDEALERIEEELTAIGCTVSILTQDGSEMPDAHATHPDIDETLAIEVETTTPENPAKVLTNLRKAQDAGEFPLFVVQSGTAETDWAARVEGILSKPVRELQNGETRFYTTDERISFNGGAGEDGGVTAVRPASGGRQNIWQRDDDEIVLRDAAGTEYVRVATLDGLSKERVPAIYSYDPAADEYVVHDHGTRHTHESKSAFESEWVRLKHPFIPEAELPVPDYDRSSYRIVILRDDGDAVIYDQGETAPLSTLLEQPRSPATASPVEEDVESTSGSEPEETPNDSTNEPPSFETFVDTHLVEDADATVAKDTVYERYLDWAAAEGIDDPMNKSWFTRTLNNHLDIESTRRRVDGDLVRQYSGVRVAEDGDS